ncbi:MAG: hypothetical protein LBB90_03535 [Tannerella sp.]|nr:hypothetical protein [Tannerella sp.]
MSSKNTKINFSTFHGWRDPASLHQGSRVARPAGFIYFYQEARLSL